jgi:hypothetical protein
MLIGPAVRRPEPAAYEAATRKHGPALCYRFRVQRFAVDADAVLEPHVRGERGGLLLGSRQEQVVDRAEERIDAEAFREMVPCLAAELR